GILHSAVADLIAWVEDGVDPPASTGYTWERDNRLHLAAGADDRGGLQPLAHLTVDGRVRAEVDAGQPVSLEVEATAPLGGFVAVDWDCTGVGVADHHEEVADAPSSV